MLTIVLPSRESWDAANQVFVDDAELVVELEHSLVSLSKWESIFKKPFLSEEEKNQVELLGYVRAMCRTPNLPEDAFERLTEDHWRQINEYLNDSMTATWFREKEIRGVNSQAITSELIYYWMNAAQINWEAQNWHLSRLFVLLRIHSEENQRAQQPKGKMSADALRDRHALIKQRRQEAAQRR